MKNVSYFINSLRWRRKLSSVWVLLLMLFIAFSYTAELRAATLAEKVALADRLKKEALLAEQEGFYDKSIALAREIQQITSEIENLANIARRWYVLRNRISVAKQVRADFYAPDEYTMAFNFYNKSYQEILDETLSDAEISIEEGLRYADLAIEKARPLFLNEKNKAIIKQADKDRSKGKKVVIEELPEMEIVKMENEFYVVRLVPRKRDCLWRIAEYQFVYDNPWKWPVIFEANNNIIKDPDLIYPGQKLIIPPVAVEPNLPGANPISPN